jgi:PhnB protein
MARNASTTRRHVPEGWPVLVPRIVAEEPAALVAFVKEVFGAAGSFHAERPCELRIGDSMLMISGTTGRERMPAFLYVYVEDTDLTYRRALAGGATSMEEPRDLPYGDRRAMVRDPWGNTWQIATHSGSFTP